MFKVGDEVVINPSSKYRDQGYDKNLEEMVGVVVEDGLSYRFVYFVQWADGNKYFYNDYDLLYSTPTNIEDYL